MVQLKPLLKTLTLYIIALIFVSLFLTWRIQSSMDSTAHSPRGGYFENKSNFINSKYYNAFDYFWKDKDDGFWMYSISGVDCAYYKILDSPWQWTSERRLLDMTMVKKWAESMIDLIMDMLRKGMNISFDMAVLLCKYIHTSIIYY